MRLNGYCTETLNSVLIAIYIRKQFFFIKNVDMYWNLGANSFELNEFFFIWIESP